MFDRILVPVDGSEAADAALDHALAIAAAHSGTVHVLFVADTNRDSLTQIHGEVVDALEREGQRLVEATVERVSQRGVTVEGEVVQGDPAGTISGYAEQYAYDLVVMGTHGRSGLERYLLGSVTERVVRSSSVPVLTLRKDDTVTYPPERVLVPTDGSEDASVALGLGTDLVVDTAGTLHLLSVVEVGGLGIDVRSTIVDELDDAAGRTVEEAATTAREAGVADVVADHDVGTVWRTIVDYVEAEDIDLVVMGTHGRSGIERALLGSVTERVLRATPVPVLTTRRADEAE